MFYKARKRFGKFCFNIWCKISPSMTEHFQDYDTFFFFRNELDPNYPWKNYLQKNAYFKQWGFDVPQYESEYYSKVSGIKADYYVNRLLVFHYIYPYLNRYDFVPAYMDKNIQKKLLGLPDNKNGFLATNDIIYNSNGSFFKQVDLPCTEEEAIEILISYDNPLIIKPTIETFGGHGVELLPAGLTRNNLIEIFKKYKRDFTFQEVIEQHPDMAKFNPSSINTLRIVTYQDFSGFHKILYACVRFGGKGSIKDNVCSGGGYTGIDIETGNLRDRRIYSYHVSEPVKDTDIFPSQIPQWEKVKSAALELHRRLPQLRIIGWDFAVSTNGKPVFVEFNPRPGIGLQQAVGPMFSKEDLDELLSHVTKSTISQMPFGVTYFNDYPERKTIHSKFVRQ